MQEGRVQEGGVQVGGVQEGRVQEGRVQVEGAQIAVQVVGGAIVDSLARPRLLLAARRTAPPAFAGMWEFPGGKVEPGETHEAALHRELAEELGVRVQLGQEVAAPHSEGWPLNEKAAMRVWFAEIVDGDPAPLEDHDELRWVPLDDVERLTGLAWIPADFPIVEAVSQMARTARPARPRGGA